MEKIFAKNYKVVSQTIAKLVCKILQVGYPPVN